MAFKSEIVQYFEPNFEIVFKCMSGATTKKGKFIMPLKEKLSYDDTVNVCDSEGFTICLDFIMSCIQGKPLRLS